MLTVALIVGGVILGVALGIAVVAGIWAWAVAEVIRDTLW